MTLPSRSISGDFSAAGGVASSWVTHGGVLQPSVPVYFAGTAHRDDLPAETMKKRAARNQETLETAIRILSQCPTGRTVLQIASAAQFRIVFDELAARRIGANGVGDIAGRKIILRDHDDPLKLAMLLAHECAHAQQAALHPAAMPSTLFTPTTFIRNSFAIEADAYAHQVQVALELAYQDPQGGDRVYSNRLLTSMRRDYPALMQAAERVIRSYDDIASGRAASFAFRAFYAQDALRDAYQDSAMAWLHAKAAQHRAPVSPRLYHADMVAADVLRGLRLCNRSYVAEHQPDINLDAEAYSAVTMKTAESIVALYDRFLPHHARAIPKIVVRVPRLVYRAADRRVRQQKKPR